MAFPSPKPRGYQSCSVDLVDFSARNSTNSDLSDHGSLTSISQDLNSTYTAGVWRRTIERISAIIFRVLNMKAAVQFYRNVLGMELLCGGEQASFPSLRPNNSESAILNLEQGDTVSRWGRLIFHVTDVDAFWTHLKERGFNPEIPRDSCSGERDFNMLDPDGHELSFAKPLQ
jgi:catechol 2,3-dioxygenase-like lactoylglutathione lyase family enzyme